MRPRPSNMRASTRAHAHAHAHPHIHARVRTDVRPHTYAHTRAHFRCRSRPPPPPQRPNTATMRRASPDRQVSSKSALPSLPAPRPAPTCQIARGGRCCRNSRGCVPFCALRARWHEIESGRPGGPRPVVAAVARVGRRVEGGPRRALRCARRGACAAVASGPAGGCRLGGDVSEQVPSEACTHTHARPLQVPWHYHWGLFPAHGCSTASWPSPSLHVGPRFGVQPIRAQSARCNARAAAAKRLHTTGTRGDSGAAHPLAAS